MSQLQVGGAVGSVTADEIALDASSQGYWQRAWRRLRRDHSCRRFGGSVPGLICLMAIGAPLISAYVTHYEPQTDRPRHELRTRRRHNTGSAPTSTAATTSRARCGPSRISLTVGVGAAFVALRHRRHARTGRRLLRRRHRRRDQRRREHFPVAARASSC